MVQIQSILELKEWERNPRKITRKALEGLKHSIHEFGDISGIVFNERNMRLVCGHQRLRALREEFGPELEVKDNMICLPNGEKIPIRVVDWDEDKHVAANIVANSPHVSGGYENDELSELLKEVKENDEDLFESLNFDDFDLPGEEEDLDPVYPIEPMLSEKYDAVLIFARNEIDWAFVKCVLNLEDKKSYKNSHVGETHVVDAAEFAKLWKSRS